MTGFFLPWFLFGSEALALCWGKANEEDGSGQVWKTCLHLSGIVL